MTRTAKSSSARAVTRAQVLGLRVHSQQLDRETGGTVADTTLLDFGAQDTGPDGGRWALAIRGVEVATATDDDLALLWTLRGAPHFYRRSDLASVAAAVAPFSDADAGKRIFDASKPLKAAGISNLDALDAVAAQMRKVVSKPTVKGDVSTRLTALMPEPYLRWCNPCQATHLHEMPFRLAAVRAGLELRPDTSPPVLQRIKGLSAADLRRARDTSTPADPRHDVVRTFLHLLGPSKPQLAAAFIDAPINDVKARWPEDVVEVSLGGERRWLLATDETLLDDASPAADLTRLLGPYDLYLQGKDRPLLVDDKAHAKALWPVIGRPGAVLVAGEIVGSWRPRKSGQKLRLEVVLWSPTRRGRGTAHTRRTRDNVAVQAERLAAYRGLTLAGVDVRD
ncbi:MAG TPA: crosslink repair DNA glycosylase YcaQ family protein [Actinomycetes bacterium]|nr:crosslink repair DNA glycosylase YcaQ family protein [Actinomycetes bacterium]